MKSWPQLVVGGVVYKDAKLMKVEPDGLRILHHQGVAKLSIELLPDDLKKEMGLREDQAKIYRDQEEAKKIERIKQGRAVNLAREVKEKRRLGNLKYQYMVLRIDRVLPDGDLFCYRHQEGDAVGRTVLALNTLRRPCDRQLHVTANTEYDRPIYLTGVKQSFGEGEIIRGNAARAGVKDLNGRVIPWFVAQIP